MKLNKKVIIVLMITGWIRVLFIIAPIAWIWVNSVANDTEYIKK